MDIKSVSMQCDFPQQDRLNRPPVRGRGKLSLILEVEGPPELVAFIAEEFRSLPGSMGWLALLYKALVVEEPGPVRLRSDELQGAPDAGAAE